MTDLKEYTEGKTTFLTADVTHYTAGKKQPTTDMPVFYNPRMRINRDLSVAILASYMKQARVATMCEPLAGSGIRTLRYLNETLGDFKAILCDANPIAVDTARRNIERNGFDGRAKVIRGDAKVLLLTESREKRFDFVDIDPFGTPVPYLNAAIQSLNPRGALLGATATDMPALCGVYPNVALRKYGGISMRAPFVHELAVRLLMGRIYDLAAMNDCAIMPLAALSTDHYIRIWVKVRADRTKANKQRNSIGFIRVCRKCYGFDSTRIGEPTCPQFGHQAVSCDGRPTIAGPLWTGQLFNDKILEGAKGFMSENPEIYHKKAGELLELMDAERELIAYPYIDLHALCDMYNFPSPRREEVIQTLRAHGYRAERTHFRPTAIRTDASSSNVVGIIRTLVGVDHTGQTEG